MSMTVFLGYDAREHEAAQVAAHSIHTRACEPVNVYILEHMELRRLKLFDRDWTVDCNGQFRDVRDTRPFSTAFSHSRFLVFHLARALKCTDPCMFIDCDWLFQTDPCQLLADQYQHSDKIGVVMRDRKVEEGSVKMDGMLQHNYQRKLWSAMFSFMPMARWASHFHPSEVNENSGRELHAFRGLGLDQFWEINPAWHYIPSLDTCPPITYGYHFSEFSPWLNPEKASEYPREFAAWEQERDAMLRARAANPSRPLWRNLTQDLAAARS